MTFDAPPNEIEQAVQNPKIETSSPSSSKPTSPTTPRPASPHSASPESSSVPPSPIARKYEGKEMTKDELLKHREWIHFSLFMIFSMRPRIWNHCLQCYRW